MSRTSPTNKINSNIYAIVDYFTLNPHKTLTSSEISDKLKIDPKIVKNVISELSSKYILKKEEGEEAYRFNINIDRESAAMLHKHIYLFLDKSIGREVAQNVMKIAEERFDDSRPITSICVLIKEMGEAFGKDMTENIVQTSVKFELGERVEWGKLIEIERMAVGKG